MGLMIWLQPGSFGLYGHDTGGALPDNKHGLPRASCDAAETTVTSPPGRYAERAARERAPARRSGEHVAKARRQVADGQEQGAVELGPRDADAVLTDLEGDDIPLARALEENDRVAERVTRLGERRPRVPRNRQKRAESEPTPKPGARACWPATTGWHGVP